MSDIEVPVLIVGGGGCGLCTSIFLSDLGVDHLLIERHATTSHLPKAHYLNQRSMEVFRQHGVADELYAVGAPMGNMGKVGWATSLGGDGALDAKIIAVMDAFGGGATHERYSEDGPCLSTNYPQIRLEPLLRRHAEERAPGKIKFGHELISMEQDDDGVTAVVRDVEAGTTFEVRAQYVVGADGGKTIPPMLGIEMGGPTGLLDMVSTHFTADISEYFDGSCLMWWLVNPEGAGSWGSGVLVQMGPTWGKSEEWILHFTFRPDDPARFDEEAIVPRIRELLKLPNLDVKVEKVSHWILEGVLADKYQVGRILIAGDAAHRHPPTTGLGLNTAIQDAHNLAWKLAAVVKGTTSASLLETYEQERRPVGMRNVDWAMFTFLNHMVIDAGLGLLPGMSTEEQVGSFAALFSDTPMGETRRARADEVIQTQRTEFQAHDLEIGFRYDEGALVSDGTAPPPRDPMGSVHYPTSRPGHRLPHAWIEAGGSKISTLDLAGTGGGLVLITGSDDGPWRQAASDVALKLKVAIKVVSIAPGGDYVDTTGRWTDLRGIEDSGGVLVRPDHHVAWRQGRRRPRCRGEADGRHTGRTEDVGPPRLGCTKLPGPSRGRVSGHATSGVGACDPYG